MNLEKLEPLDGMIPKETVKFLREILQRAGCWHYELSDERLDGIPFSRVDELRRRGFLVKDASFGEVVSLDGRAIAGAKLMRRIGGGEAVKRLDAFVARAHDINRQQDWAFSVIKIILFGSVLSANEQTTHGDIDVAISVSGRFTANDEITFRQHQERCRELCRTHKYAVKGGLFHQAHDVVYRKTKVRLKNADTYLSITGVDGIPDGAPRRNLIGGSGRI